LYFLYWHAVKQLHINVSVCKGSGDCVVCGGDGDRSGQICGSCYGSGNCKYCQGTGDVDYGNTGNQENNPKNEYTPGFDILIVLFAISLIFFLKRKSRI